ncbi:MAG TPA: hypothetical protein VLK03_06280 [Nocardioides sp.]|nr:hypothetical protein [Nocardioides sp.]
MSHLRLFLSTHGWRPCLVASGVLLALGGRMHPSSDAEDDLRTELATMTADESWVPGHSLVLLSTVLLAAGLWWAWRTDAWPVGVRRTLGWAAVAVSCYVLEAVTHLAAVVDSDELAHGHAAPVAMTHLGLSVVLYPVTGWAIVLLAWSFGRAWGGWRRAIAAVGVVGGLLQAVSVPSTMLFPDTEVSPVFAVAAISLAAFSVLTGLVGAPRRAVVEARELQPVA